MREKVTELWHKIDGPIGAIFVAFAFGLFGYVIRGYEDGGVVATLVQQVKSASVDARADERNQCANKLTGIIQNSQQLGALRDRQIATLIYQNKTLLSLVTKSVADQSLQLRKANEAAVAAAKAADVANSTNQKVNEVSKKLESAVQPKAAVPAQPWIGNKKP